jgi:hypothetical protein
MASLVHAFSERAATKAPPPAHRRRARRADDRIEAQFEDEDASMRSPRTSTPKSQRTTEPRSPRTKKNPQTMTRAAGKPPRAEGPSNNKAMAGDRWRRRGER